MTDIDELTRRFAEGLARADAALKKAAAQWARHLEEAARIMAGKDR